MKCEKCGEKMMIDRSQVFTSIPPQYRFKCPNCGHLSFGTADMDCESNDNQTINTIKKGFKEILTVDGLRDIIESAHEEAIRRYNICTTETPKRNYAIASSIFACLLEAMQNVNTEPGTLTSDNSTTIATND